MPSGFPRINPRAIPNETGWYRADKRAILEKPTAALERAKIGITPKATHGCRASSSRAAGDGRGAPASEEGFEASSRRSDQTGMVMASITPAIVGSTPDFRRANQIPAPNKA